MMSHALPASCIQPLPRRVSFMQITLPSLSQSTSAALQPLPRQPTNYPVVAKATGLLATAPASPPASSIHSNEDNKLLLPSPKLLPQFRAWSQAPKMSDEEPEDDFDNEELREDTDEKGGEDEDEKEEAEEEEEEHPVSNPLTEEHFKEGLSLLSKTGNGLAHAFVKFEAREKELTDITLIQNFTHLRYVDLSDNLLRDLSPLSYLTHLLWLKVDNNRLTCVAMDELPYLQIASFSNNHIKDTSGINHPRLASLSLKGNEIEEVAGLDPLKLSNLHTLELRGNSLKSTAGLYLPKLKTLYLAQNSISHIEGLEDLAQLTTLHLRDNMLESLDGFSESMKSLQYLNLRGNAIAYIQEVAKLQKLPMLRALVLLDNPCSEEGDYRLETLVLLPRLERLDKDFFEEDERLDAEDVRQRRREEELELEREAEREKELELDLEGEETPEPVE